MRLRQWLMVLLPTVLFCCDTVIAQRRIQQFDDNVMIDVQNTRTPEQTDFFLFLTNTYRYGAIGVPAGLLIGGMIDHNQEMRQNALFVASSTATSYALEFLIKQIVKRPRPFVQNHHIIPVYRAG